MKFVRTLKSDRQPYSSALEELVQANPAQKNEIPTQDVNGV